MYKTNIPKEKQQIANAYIYECTDIHTCTYIHTYIIYTHTYIYIYIYIFFFYIYMYILIMAERLVRKAVSVFKVAKGK